MFQVMFQGQGGQRLRIMVYFTNSNDLLFIKDCAMQNHPLSRSELAISGALQHQLELAESRLRELIERNTTRTARLQQLTTALGLAHSPDDVAAAVLNHVIPGIGAYGGGLLLLSPDGASLEMIHVTTSSYPPNLNERWQRVALSDPVPATEAIRLRRPIWLNNREAWLAQYPTLSVAQNQTASQSLAALPLIVDERAVGVLALSFANHQPFDADDRAFMQTIALQCAQAIERARLLVAERAARARAEAQQQSLRLLSEASIRLAASLDYPATLSQVTHLMIPTLADWCMLDLVGPDGQIHRIAAAHADPALQPLVERMLGFGPGQNPHNPVMVALQTGKPQRANDVPDDLLVAGTINDEHLALVRALNPTAFLIVPLVIHDSVLGALTCAMADSGRSYSLGDQELAAELARRAAHAIEHAQTYRQMQEEIARRQQAEADLRWQAGLLDQTADAVVVWEYGGPIIFWNRGAEQIYGFTRDAAIGQIVHTLLQTRHPVELPIFLEALALAGEWQGELIQATSDGRQVVVASRQMLMLQPSGRHYVLEANRDITGRKQAEEQRVALDRKLQDVQRMESLGLLAGGIAHDFNNLLVAILGNAELALLDLAPESPAREPIEQISTAAHRAADLTRQLLAYAGRGPLVMRPLMINALVEEMLHLLRAAIAKNVLLHFTPADNLHPIIADATQLRQVLMNLVVNASEAIGTKSGSILISTGMMWADSTYLRETLPGTDLAEGDYVIIEVADSGAGMSAEIRARIFDPFFTTKFTGRGLGLAATIGIMRGHKGSIRVYSEPGQGSTFKLLLPVAPNAQPPLEHTPQPARLWRGSGTVLVIDDECEVRAIVGRMLERLGFAVLTAEDGQVGIERFKAHIDEITCVLLDLTMPHMNGAETFRLIKQLRPKARVVLMSGYAEHETTLRFAGKGLEGFLPKPFRPHDLAAMLQRLLE